MTQLAETTRRARQLFLLAAIVLSGLMLFVSCLDQLLPPLSNDPELRMAQILTRAFWSAVASTAFFAVLSAFAVRYTQRAVQSGQWPPAGTAVPFRMKVVEINRPIVAWLCLGLLLALFALQAAMPWHKHSRLKELNELVGNAAQPTVQGPASPARAEPRP